ncbi:acetyltransferase [Amycolatopsis mediterranei S699]|uniref:Acetyltransferase n=2 Tax=Amycolatopsis mediterranei TaxID=33910 RepID=A0A0H3CZR5_AMYMU|nr:GNAT family N-acetyltransferase [Amycolatopsis mediterranei]ADJ43434.1 acetyltransferase [Amycolatopsis mediterranei U32]AEK40137.1 acetyltransferase [Amycolatopsis mediterranei S699]AFO75147.1 acetyltransferase [Amycolatopsis mediterranei S699]AGT82276.1 acetyltransferase [Amycolatopsis mediterranei RB]KDO11661.1 acetyltransferase [Amycolatopsis mediterranei]
MLITTERLTLHAWSEACFAGLFALAQLPETVRYVGTGVRWSRAYTLAKHRATLAHWTEHGFGWFAVSATPGSFDGVVSLVRRTAMESGLGRPAVEMGWWIAPSAWGRGYATEATTAVRDRAFASAWADRLLAVYEPANKPSARVVEKLGFTVHSKFVLDGRVEQRAVLERPHS